MFQLTNDTIYYAALTESVSSNAAGAVVLFMGTVREMTAEGRRTMALDYEAFPQMAATKLEELLVEARSLNGRSFRRRFAHRLGRLELGDGASRWLSARPIARRLSNPANT